MDILYPLRRLHGVIYEEKLRRELKKSYRKRVYKMREINPHTVFLVMTPEHENLGDQAIADAELKLLDSIGVDYLEITDRQIWELGTKKLLHIMNGTPILVHGGGNMGTLWPNVENTHRKIIQHNPDSKILFFPNTIFYEADRTGQAELQKSIEIYNHHKDLRLYAREKTSYEAMRKVYRNVKLIPDMVLSLNASKHPQERHGCILCLRSDREKTRTEDQENSIYRQARALFGNDVKSLDMIAGGPILPEQRTAALNVQFDSFSKAKLVITDRLHGMIFCAITGTPCVVINSKSPKVLGCYEWIKDLEYIRIANDVSEITDVYCSIPNKVFEYDPAPLNHYYGELGKDILDIF